MAITRRSAACGAALVLGLLWGCGDDGPTGPTEMSVGSTQAALTANQLASGVSPTLQAAVAFVKGLPNDLKAALDEQQVIATLKQLIGGVTGCLDVTKLTARSFKIAYDSCVFGVAPRSVTVSGSLTLTLTLQPLKARGTITAKLEQLSVDGAVFDGTVSATLCLAPKSWRPATCWSTSPWSACCRPSASASRRPPSSAKPSGARTSAAR